MGVDKEYAMFAGAIAAPCGGDVIDAVADVASLLPLVSSVAARPLSMLSSDRRASSLIVSHALSSNVDASSGSGMILMEEREIAKVLFVILNFNGIADTLACLDSLALQTCQDFEILVIDNGSHADDLSQIPVRCPAAELIVLKENLGWAGGNNIGLRLAVDRGFDRVCLLNNDTILAPTMLEHLVAAAERIGQPCLLHPAIAYFDEPDRWQLYPEPSSPTDARAGGSHDQSEIFEMDYAYGACLLLSGGISREVGLLDERLFLQFEETDYHRRAAKLGFRSYCARRARILHKESASFGGRVTEAKVYYQVRNRFLIAEKHTPTLGGFWRATQAVLWTLYWQAHARDAGVNGWPSFARWLLRSDPLARAARQGARDYVRRRFGRRPVRAATR